MIRSFLLLVFYMFILLACSENKSEILRINYQEFNIRKHALKHFSELGEIEKVVQIETNDHCLVSYAINVVASNNGDIYIAEKDSQKKVFRFDKNGTFISSYGVVGEGPGESKEIACFDIDHDQSLYISGGNKIIKYNANGTFVKELKTDFDGQDIKVIGDKIYVYNSYPSFNNDKSSKHEIYIYSLDLAFVRGIGTFDERLMKHSFFPFNVLTKCKDKCFYSKLYNLGFRSIDPNKLSISDVSIPISSDKLDGLFKKKRLKSKERNQINALTHFFMFFYGSDNYIFGAERCRSKNILSFWKINPELKTIDKYPFTKLIHYLEDDKAEICFDRVSGAYKDGVILAIEDSERFQNYKNKEPLFKKIKFELSDNPILVFLRIN